MKKEEIEERDTYNLGAFLNYIRSIQVYEEKTFEYLITRLF